jgi:threonine/homoserine/homoserine lactone efflux protein
MKDLIKSLVLQNAKAIVAFVSALVFQLVGTALPEEVQVAIVGLLVALIVWLVPNETKTL